MQKSTLSYSAGRQLIALFAEMASPKDIKELLRSNEKVIPLRYSSKAATVLEAQQRFMKEIKPKKEKAELRKMIMLSSSANDLRIAVKNLEAFEGAKSEELMLLVKKAVQILN